MEVRHGGVMPKSSFALHVVGELGAQKVDWLWPGRVPLGKLAILDGDPGLGKSLIALDLCARLSTGRAFPDEAPSPGPRASLILNGEDGVQDTIRPRLRALGAEVDRVFALERISADGLDSFRIPQHARILRDMVKQTRSQLVVIDPIMAFLDATVAIGSDQSVRQALAPLAHLAGEFGCAIVLVRHLNKGGRFQSIYRGGGSIGIVGACRSGWLVARDPFEPERRVFAQVKNNLASPQPSLAYQIKTTEEGQPIVEWLGRSPWTGDQLLTSAARGADISKLEQAKEFLTSNLQKNGPQLSCDLWTLAQRQRISKTTFERAKTALGILSIRVGIEGKCLSYWLLQGQVLADEIPRTPVENGLGPYIRDLETRYARAGPFDDA
jgi:hypothetical protein